MPDRSFDSSLSLPLLASTDARGPSRLEAEVVRLFDELRAPLLRYLLGFGLPIQDGEEIVQEVFLALFRHLTEDKSRTNLRGWIFRVAHNLGLKRRGRSRRDCDEIPESIDPSPTPEDRAASGEYRRLLLAVMNALPEQDQRCLLLRAEGLRYREIAEVLSMSLGAVASSLSRSLDRMGRVAGRSCSVP